MVDPLDEEQRQRLDARRDDPASLLQYKLQLLLEVALDRLPQHEPLLLVIGLGGRGPDRDLAAVAELDERPVAGVDVLHRPALVDLAAAADLVEVVILADRDLLTSLVPCRPAT